MIKELEKLYKELNAIKLRLNLKKIRLNKNTFEYLANEVQIKDVKLFQDRLKKIIERKEND